MCSSGISSIVRGKCSHISTSVGLVNCSYKLMYCYSESHGRVSRIFLCLLGRSFLAPAPTTKHALASNTYSTGRSFSPPTTRSASPRTFCTLLLYLRPAAGFKCDSEIGQLATPSKKFSKARSTPFKKGLPFGLCA